MDYVVLIGWRGFEVTSSGGDIRRYIKHFINYSVRPSIVHLPYDKPCYSGNDILLPSKMNQPVLYSTHLSATGYGLRPFLQDELAAMFGFSNWDLRFKFFAIPPMHILITLIQEIPGSKGQPLPSNCFNWTNDSPSSISTSTWLPTINKYLCHSWMNTSADNTKAVKSDDAGVPISLWDSRCTLVFNHHSSTSLHSFRRLLLSKQVVKIYLEIRSYMSATFGANWSELLTKARQAQVNNATISNAGGGDSNCNVSNENDNNAKGVNENIDNDSNEIISITGNACAEALFKWSCSSWWKWNLGSRLLFWRWGSSAQHALLVFKPWVQSPLPHYFKRMVKPNKDLFPRYLDKLTDVTNKGYIKIPSDQSIIKSLFDWFGVPKGDDDIRMVYNGTSCGLNQAVWATNFWLPTAKTAARSLSYNYCFMDKDLGEMFLNFPLHHSLAAYSGVDLTYFKNMIDAKPNVKLHTITKDRRKRTKFSNNKRLFGYWERCWMGLSPSPYWSVCFFYLADEFVRGNHRDPKNALRWDKIILNLPGDTAFNPTLPWVMKWDSILNHISGDIVGFVDD